MKHLLDVLCRALIVSILILPLILSASADRLEFCDSIPEDFVDWNSSVALPKFDPEMGTLRAVDLLCTMNLSQENMLENRNSQPANFTVSLYGTLTMQLPSSESVLIGINHSTEGNLSGYDNVTDYGGTSGINSTESIPTEAASMSISNIGDFLAGAPGENITLPVKVNIASQTRTSGTFISAVVSKAGAEVCVSYTYDAK
jgi:hypothetical protein